MTAVSAELAASDPACCGTDPDSGTNTDMTPTMLDVAEAEQLAALLKAVADPVRLRLLSLIARSSDGETCVCNLTGPVGLTQPTVSHHLKILVEAGLLTRDQRGKWAYYRLVPGAAESLGGHLIRALVRS